MNVAQTYIEMMKSQDVSEREAIRQICEAVGLKFAASYAKEWADDDNTRPIPPAAVEAMQQRSALYAANKAGIKTTGDKAQLFADLLSPKVKKKT